MFKSMKRGRSTQIADHPLHQSPDRTAKQAEKRTTRATLTSKLYSEKLEHEIEKDNAFKCSLKSLRKYFQDIEEEVTTQFACCQPAVQDESRQIPTLFQIYAKVLNEIQSCLPSTDIYIGEYEALTETSTPRVMYVAASSESKMLYRTLLLSYENNDNKKKNRTTAAFQAILGRIAVIIHDIANSLIPLHRFDNENSTGAFACFPLLDMPSNVESVVSGVICLDTCRAARRSLPQKMSPPELHAFLSEYMGLGMVAKELRKLEISGEKLFEMSRSQLRHLLEFQGISIEDRRKLHFILTSIRKGLPIANLVPSSRQTIQFTKKYTSLFQSEAVLEYLQEVAALLGSCLKRYRRYHWLLILSNCQNAADANTMRTRGLGCGHFMIYKVYHKTLWAIYKALLAVDNISIWRICKSEDAKIHLLSTLRIQSDRLLPFVHCDVHEMKRVTLYKFSQIPVDEIHVRQDEARIDLQPLIQGHVISLERCTSPGYSDLCRTKILSDTQENLHSGWKALYTVKWKDGTIEILSWERILHSLSLRPMHPGDLELKKFTRKVRTSLNGYEIMEKAESNIVINMEDSNSMVLILDIASTDWIFYTQIDLNRSYHVGPDDERFLNRLQAATISNLRQACDYESCHRKLKLSYDRIKFLRQSLDHSAFEVHNQISLDIIKSVSQDIQNASLCHSLQVFALKDERIQVLFDSICLEASNSKSSYIASELPALFKLILTSKITLIEIPDRTIHELAKMDCRNEKSTMKKEAFICNSCPCMVVPLYHQDRAVGVMIVNGISSFLAKPIKTIFEYFENAAEIISLSLYSARSVTILQQIRSKVFREIATPHQIFYYCMEAVRDNFPGMPKVQLLSIAPNTNVASLMYEFSNVERLLISNSQEPEYSYFHKVEPMSFWADDLSDGSIATNFDLPIELVPKYRVAARQFSFATYPIKDVSLHEFGSSCSTIKTTSIRVGFPETASIYFAPPPVAIYRSVHLPFIAEYKDEDDKASLALKAFFGTRRYLGTFISDMGLPLFATNRLMEHKNEKEQGKEKPLKLYLTCTATHMGIKEQVFLDHIGKILSNSYYTFRVRENRSRIRVQCVKEFSEFCKSLLARICTNAPPRFEPIEELKCEILLEAQEKLISLLGDTMPGANAYIGMYQPRQQRLYYSCASKTSSMRGRYLNHENGISFYALSSSNVLIVKSEDIASDLLMFRKFGGRVHIFDADDTNMWPYVIVPIGRYGTLSVDNVTDHAILSADKMSPEPGIIDTLISMANILKEAIHSIRVVTLSWRKDSLRKSLAQIRTSSEAVLKVPTDCIYNQVSSASTYISSRSHQTSSSLLSFLQCAIESLEEAICGINAYIGMVQPLCEKLHFTSSTQSSNMLNKFVSTWDSIYFEAFLSTKTITNSLTADPTSPQRIQRSEIGSYSLLQSQENESVLFCTSIPSFGVLVVDTFAGAAGNWFGNDDCCPEREVTESLEAIANLISHALRNAYTQEAIVTMDTLKNAKVKTCHELFRHIVLTLSQNLLSLIAIRAVRVPMEILSDTAATSKSSGVEELAYMANKNDGVCTNASMMTNDSAIIQETRRYFNAKRIGAADTQSQRKSPEHLPLIAFPCEGEDINILFVHQTYLVKNAQLHPCATMIILKRAQDKCQKRTSYDAQGELENSFGLDESVFISQIYRRTNLLIKQCNSTIRRATEQQKVRALLQRIEVEMESIAAFPALKQFYTSHIDSILEAISLSLNCVEEPAHLFLAECDLKKNTAQIVATSSKRLTMKHQSLKLDSRHANRYDPDMKADLRVRLGEIILSCVTSGKLLLSELSSDCIGNSKGETSTRVDFIADSPDTLLAVPVGRTRVMCIERLHLNSEVTPSRLKVHEEAYKCIEKCVRVFLKFCADELDRIISVNRLRCSYEEILACTHQPQKISLREYFGLLMRILNRDLTGVQSQQIMILGEDFVSNYRVVCWQHFPIPRLTEGLIQHFCYLEGCDSEYLKDGQNIHFENQLCLPMTNLPRTLDHSRSENGRPVHGIEKRGNFTLVCMALMLDSTVSIEPRIALCVYQTSDQYHNWRHRTYFEAFGAVACYVYARLYPSWVLKTYSLELYCRLEQEINLLRWMSSDHKYKHGQNQVDISRISGNIVCIDLETGSDAVNIRVPYSNMSNEKMISNSKFRKRLKQLYASNKKYNIFASKRLTENVLPVDEIDLWIDHVDKKQSSTDRYAQLKMILQYPLHILHHKTEKPKDNKTEKPKGYAVPVPKSRKGSSNKVLPSAIKRASSRALFTDVANVRRKHLKLKLYPYVRGYTASDHIIHQSELTKRDVTIEYIIFSGVEIESAKMAQSMESILERTTQHASLYTKSVNQCSIGGGRCLWKESPSDFAFVELGGYYLYTLWEECLKTLDEQLEAIEVDLKSYMMKFEQGKRLPFVRVMKPYGDVKCKGSLNNGNEVLEKVVVVLLRIALILSRSKFNSEDFKQIVELKGTQVVLEVLNTSSLNQLRALDLKAPEFAYKRSCARILFHQNADAFLTPMDFEASATVNFIENEDVLDNPFYAIYNLEIVFLSIIQYLEVMQTLNEAKDSSFIYLVTKLQSQVRIRLSRKLLNSRRLQINAIKKLQRFTRRYLEKKHSFQLESARAASAIQRTWRNSKNYQT